MLPKTVDVSKITGAAVTGPPASWQTPNGPFNVEHIAGRTPAGDLVVFWWSPQHDWQSVNVSTKTGRRIAGTPAEAQRARRTLPDTRASLPQRPTARTPSA